MFKPFRFLVGLLVLAWVLSGTALAQEGPITPQHTDPGWQAWYWNNTSLAGPPAQQRFETNLDYNWGDGFPAPGVNANQFSARWSRYIDVPPSDYRFSVTADDGVRLWVDDDLLIDRWHDQGATTYTAQKYLGPGHHLVRVDYYENGGQAVIRVSWTQGGGGPPPISNWRGEYFNNKTLSGPPVLVRDDPRIDFNWGGGSPAPGLIDADGFSARWSRSLDLPPGNYRFNATIDDGARLFVNGHTLLDAWKDQSPRSYSGDIYLPGGSIMIQMEYYENGGGAVARLAVGSADNPPPPPPPPPPPVEAIGYVKSYRLNLRSGPGLHYPVVGLLYRGEPMRLLGRNSAGSWLKVVLPYNARGWVYSSYIWSEVPIANLPVIW
jgi:hypothetical protein